MYRGKVLFLLAVTFFVATIISLPAYAIAPVESKNKGLYISPLRNYLTLDAGATVTRAFTVANLTEEPMTVSSHIQRFSVTDYAYDYRFDETNNDWLSLVQTSVTLKPYESRELAYKVQLPANATPGGHYYTLYASATIKSGATTSTVQAATLLYLTVNGTLKRSSETTTRNLPYFVTSHNINYSIDIKNTGNTHYFALVSTRVDGLFYHNAPNGSSQLLMPGKVRNVATSIVSPPLPGVYKLTYTVTPDQGTPTQDSRYFVYAPLWFIIFLGFAAVAAVRIIQNHRKKRQSTSPESIKT